MDKVSKFILSPTWFLVSRESSPKENMGLGAFAVEEIKPRIKIFVVFLNEVIERSHGRENQSCMQALDSIGSVSRSDEIRFLMVEEMVENIASCDLK